MEDISQLIPVIERYLPKKQQEISDDVKDTLSIHMTVTYAQSLDGRISAGRGLRTKLSGPASHTLTHYIRSRHHAILVGIGTLLADNPRLSCRYPGTTRHPQPIILDTTFRWPVDEKHWELLEGAKLKTGLAPWVLVGPEASSHPKYSAKKALVTAVGGRVIELPDLHWHTIHECLRKEGMHSVMVEGGAAIIDTALRSGKTTSVIATIAPVYLGSGGVDIAPGGRLDLVDIEWATAGADAIVCGRLAD